jgi:hypothetical protein
MWPLIAGKWKLHGIAPQLAEIEAIGASVKAFSPPADSLICLPAMLIGQQGNEVRILYGGAVKPSSGRNPRTPRSRARFGRQSKLKGPGFRGNFPGSLGAGLTASDTKSPTPACRSGAPGN